MAKIGIFYGSSTGNTEAAANQISEALGGVDVFDIALTPVSKMNEYDVLLLGSSTMGFGDLQDDWEGVVSDLEALDLSGKKVSFFGTGDQVFYEDSFCDALGILYESVQDSGATFIGKWSTDNYEFTESRAVVESMFIGLALDEDNQEDLTEERIQSWVEKLQSEIE